MTSITNLEELKKSIADHHEMIRRNGAKLHFGTGEKRGTYIIRFKTLAEYTAATEPQFLAAEFITDSTDLHDTIKECIDEYDPVKSFIYVIMVESLPTGWKIVSVVSPQLVYKKS